MLTQPDGGGLEGCGFIDFWSYRATSNWQDIPCSKKLTGHFVCQQRARSNSESDGKQSSNEILARVSFTYHVTYLLGNKM